MQRKVIFSLVLMLLFVGAAPAYAHVPYIERQDYSWPNPFVVNDVEQSKAVYSWLETGEDVDFFLFDISEPTDLFVEVIVPECTAYAQFLPSYAILGPDLPEPSEPLPVNLPEGYGAIVVPNLEPGEPRNTFFEPFGGKFYYEGVQFNQEVDTPGWWGVIVWDPYQMGGDYTASIGLAERFTPGDILRSLINTPYVRQDRELHTDDCNTRAAE